MLKKIYSFSLILTLLFPYGAPAAELAPAGTPARKMQRGFLNVALAPIEMVYSLDQGRKEESFLPGWFLGSLKGIGATAVRALTGVCELLTGPFAQSADHRPVLNPEFPWELLGPIPSSPEESLKHKP